MPGAAISVSALRKSYGATEVVHGIDFEVQAGEVLGLLGENGAGKTTTVEVLEGYHPRDGGAVSVLGVDPAQPTRAWRERLGIVLQQCEFEPTATVRETLGLYASFFSRPRPVDDVIELVGLGDRRDERIGRLSGGQKRRVDVAVALVGDPDLVFLDEPTTGFDPSARREFWNVIEGLRELGKTILLTTHYMDEAQHLADRVAIMRGGHLVAQGRPDELGGEHARETVIGFELPAGTGLDAVRAAADGARVEASGNAVTVRTEAPQRTLHRLTSWAEESRIELRALEVRRPSLEDVFLQLTGDASGAGGSP